MSIIKYCFITVILFIPLNSANSHGSGQILQKEIGEYSVDIDYDSLVPEISSGEAVRFNFNLWNKDRSKPMDFTGVWVRVAFQQEPGILFAGNLGVPESGFTGISYTFSRGGSYELTVRFEDREKVLAEAAFPLTVTAGEQSSAQAIHNLFISGFIGIILGVIISYIIMNKRRA